MPRKKELRTVYLEREQDERAGLRGFSEAAARRIAAGIRARSEARQ